MRRKSRGKTKIILLCFLIAAVFAIVNGIEINPDTASKPKADNIKTEKKAEPQKNEKKADSDGITYYVSATGKDSNDGLSEKTPFQTIRKAVQVVEPGDTVLIGNGIYHEAISMKTSGKKGAPITFQKYGDEAPVIDGTGKTAIAGIRIAGKDYIIINGLSVQNFTSTDESAVIGIFIEGNSKGIEIRNCKVHDISTTYDTKDSNRNAHGIAVYGTKADYKDPIQGLILDNNEVYNCRLGQSEAIALNGNVSNFRVTNNKVHDNDNIGIDLIGFEGTANHNKAGDPDAKQDRVRNGICSGNEIWNISSAKNPTYRGERSAGGIYVDGGYHIVIEKNKIDKCDIGIEASSEHKGCSAEKITIRNNLVANCKGYAGISFGGADASENGDARGIAIVNNTLYNNQPNINIANADSSTNIVVNNICYRGSYLNGTIGKNTVSGNYTKNPQFVNTTTWDFHLKPGSPVIDAGIAADYGETDMAGSKRVKGKAVDLGAFEF